MKARNFVAALYSNVEILDTSGRGSSITFTRRGIGDVLLNWENEAKPALGVPLGDRYQIIYVSRLILAEPPVALDQNVDRHKSRAAAERFLKFLYIPQAQQIQARHFFRPRDPFVMAAHKADFPRLPLATINGNLGGWAKAQAVRFAYGGTFDQIYQPGK